MILVSFIITRFPINNNAEERRTVASPTLSTNNLVLQRLSPSTQQKISIEQARCITQPMNNQVEDADNRVTKSCARFFISTIVYSILIVLYHMNRRELFDDPDCNTCCVIIRVLLRDWMYFHISCYSCSYLSL